MYKINIKEYLEELKKIKKENLSEREFYEKVLTVISKMEDVYLTEESAEELKQTLLEIGCVDYTTWKAEKEKEGTILDNEVMGEGIRKGSISAAVSFINQLLGDYDQASFGLSFMLDGGEKHGWVQSWLRNSKNIRDDKKRIPYYMAAKEALMKWNNLSEEEAIRKITTESFEEIESQVYARGSMEAAMEGIAKYIGIPENEEDKKVLFDDLASFVYDGKLSPALEKSIKSAVRRSSVANGKEKDDYNDLIMSTLFNVHDTWVRDNSKKYNLRDKKYQHMPSELIGWEEVKADLLFVKPIFEAMGIEVNEEELEKVYNERVKEFFLKHNIRNREDLAKLIAKGPEFYPTLEGYGEILNGIKDLRVVNFIIIPSIEEKGIGNIEEKRKEIVESIIENPNSADLARLTEEEIKEVESSIGEEIETAVSEADDKKETIVGRIISLAARRDAIKKEIERRSKGNNTHNTEE